MSLYVREAGPWDAPAVLFLHSLGLSGAMWRQEEPFVTRHSAYELSRALPGATCVLVPGVGHLWNLEALDLFTQTVRAWMQNKPLPLKLVPF